jgi:uncharacterized protein (TIGR00730 family)
LPIDTIQQNQSRALCVFGGSRAGARTSYTEVSREAGRAIARAGYGLVYGGGPTGVMGAVADGVWDEDGEVACVIPRFLQEREGNNDPRLRKHIVDTLQERKTLMADLSDGFLILPGGLGTYDELFEAITWSQLEVNNKKVCVLDIDGFFTPVRNLLTQLIDEQFVEPHHLRQVLVTSSCREAVQYLTATQEN